MADVAHAADGGDAARAADAQNGHMAPRKGIR
jgi:hypothetical protein